MRKNLLPLSKIVCLLFLVLATFSCQHEENVEKGTEPDENTFGATSDMAGYLSRVAMNGGSADNFLDNSSRISFQLPVTVMANGFQVTVETSSQFQQVYNILNASDTDDDTVSYNYPVTITAADYTTITVTSDEQIESVFEEYATPAEEPVECLDFVYPITFYTFNGNEEEVDTVEVNNDAEMYLFLSSLPANFFASIVFPITVTVNGEEQAVTGNGPLQTLINGCGQTTTGGSGGYYDYSITDILQQVENCTWNVSDVLDADNPGPYTDGYFTFNDNGITVLTTDTGDYPGTWSVDITTTGNYSLNIDVDGFPEFSNQWLVMGITETQVSLVFGNDMLELMLNCDNQPIATTCSEAEIAANLLECIWKITDYNGSTTLSSYNLIFNADGSLQFIQEPGLFSTTTTYMVGVTTTGVMINFGAISGPSIQVLTGTWAVTDCGGAYIELTDVIDGNTLTLEKECATTTCSDTFVACSDESGTGTFMLTDYEECILAMVGLDDGTVTNNYTVSFYPNVASAQTASNALLPVFTTQLVQQTIYVRIENDNTGLYIVVPIYLIINGSC